MSTTLNEIIACPRCKGRAKKEGEFFVCERCGLAFPIFEGEVPDMLMEDAWDLRKAKESGFKHDLGR